MHNYTFKLVSIAMKNPQEFFAESMAHYLSGYKLPKRIQVLIDESLKA